MPDDEGLGEAELLPGTVLPLTTATSVVLCAAGVPPVDELAATAPPTFPLPVEELDDTAALLLTTDDIVVLCAPAATTCASCFPATGAAAFGAAAPSCPLD